MFGRFSLERPFNPDHFDAFVHSKMSFRQYLSPKVRGKLTDEQNAELDTIYYYGQLLETEHSEAELLEWVLPSDKNKHPRYYANVINLSAYGHFKLRRLAKYADALSDDIINMEHYQSLEKANKFLN